MRNKYATIIVTVVFDKTQRSSIGAQTVKVSEDIPTQKKHRFKYFSSYNQTT